MRSRRRPSGSFPDAQIAVQMQRRGTAHAVLAARRAIARGFDDLLVIFADTPLIARGDASKHCAARLHKGAAVAVPDFAPPIRPVMAVCW